MSYNEDDEVETDFRMNIDDDELGGPLDAEGTPDFLGDSDDNDHHDPEDRFH